MTWNVCDFEDKDLVGSHVAFSPATSIYQDKGGKDMNSNLRVFSPKQTALSSYSKGKAHIIGKPAYREKLK